MIFLKRHLFFSFQRPFEILHGNSSALLREKNTEKTPLYRHAGDIKKK